MKIKANMGILIVIGVALLIVGSRSVVRINAGHVGVKDLFGDVKPDILYSGLKLVNPLVTVRQMSIQKHNITEQAKVPSKEGLIFDLDVTLLYRLDPSKAPQVYRQFQKEYVSRVVEPSLRSVVREVTTSFEAKALYTEGRKQMSVSMQSRLEEDLKEYGIIVEEVFLRNIELPQQISEEIQNKLKAEQQAERRKHILKMEQIELEVKKVKSQQIEAISKHLNDNYLKWEGIEATKALAESHNTKIVVIGSGKDGLPLILGGN